MKTAKKMMCALLLFTFMMFAGSTGDVQAESTSGVEIYNRDGLTITATGLSNGELGEQIDMTFENNGAGGVMVQARGVSVNGFMVQNAMSVDVPAGETVYDSLALIIDDLKGEYITTIAEIEFSLEISDLETWDIIDTSDPAIITVSGTDDYVQEYDDSGEVLYDDNGFRIISKGVQEGIAGPELILFMDNDSEEDFYINAESASINGIEMEPEFYADVLPSGKCALDEMTFTYHYDVFQMDPEEIHDIEFTLEITDPDTYETLYELGPFEISFQ